MMMRNRLLGYREKKTCRQKWLFKSNRKRVGFLKSSVDRFVQRHAADVNRSTRFSQLSETEREEMFFEFPGDERGTGTFFWRIGTGELINNEEQTRLWTRYGRFSVYESVIDRIKERKELIVGTSATFLSYDHPIDENGRPQTFDMDFIDWIVMKLEMEFEFPEHTITVRLVPTKWGDELFNSVVNGDVDVAIANITRSVARERKYPGL